MGEYAYFRGERIKIGTCEDMLYLRAEHAPLLDTRSHEDTNVMACLDEVRFRFPFPTEDDKLPGEYDDPDKSLGLYGVTAPEGTEHGTVQFASNHPTGFLVSLPCPEGPDTDKIGFKVHRNGYAGPVHISQQKVFGNQLILIGRCGGCRYAWRYETLDMVEPVIVACRSKGDQAQHRADLHAQRDSNDLVRTYQDSTARFWHTVADRIEAGYTNPPAWIASRPVRV